MVDKMILVWPQKEKEADPPLPPRELAEVALGKQPGGGHPLGGQGEFEVRQQEAALVEVAEELILVDLF